MRFPPRSTLAALALVACSLLAAGCGGQSSPGVASTASSTAPGAAGSPAATSSSHALLLAGRCLRQHGLPDLPDPTIAASGPAKGQAILDKRALLAAPEAVVSSAILACRAALARAGFRGGPNASVSPQELHNLLAFARCVRHHGIVNFPDPNSQGGFDVTGTGIDPHALTPAQLAAARACLPRAHGDVHIPTQGTATSSNGP